MSGLSGDLGDDGVASEVPGFSSARAKSGRRAPESSHKSTSRTPRQPDGRQCRLCGERDNSYDPVAKASGVSDDDPDACRKWANNPDKDGKTVGAVCYYCQRTFQGKYRAQGYSVQSLVALLGGNHHEHEKFMKFQGLVIQHFVEKKGVGGHMPWDDFDKKLMKMTKSFESRFPGRSQSCLGRLFPGARARGTHSG